MQLKCFTCGETVPFTIHNLLHLVEFWQKHGHFSPSALLICGGETIAFGPGVTSNPFEAVEEVIAFMDRHKDEITEDEVRAEVGK